MGGMAQTATSYVGTRVQWIGPPQTGQVAPAYWAAVDAGEQRPPTPQERRELATGEEGTVTKVLGETTAGGHYVIRFDSGYELETVLPAPTLVRFARS
jgi:hypothetical protein